MTTLLLYSGLCIFVNRGMHESFPQGHLLTSRHFRGPHKLFVFHRVPRPPTRISTSGSLNGFRKPVRRLPPTPFPTGSSLSDKTSPESLWVSLHWTFVGLEIRASVLPFGTVPRPRPTPTPPQGVRRPRPRPVYTLVLGEPRVAGGVAQHLRSRLRGTSGSDGPEWEWSVSTGTLPVSRLRLCCVRRKNRTDISLKRKHSKL